MCKSARTRSSGLRPYHNPRPFTRATTPADQKLLCSDNFVQYICRSPHIPSCITACGIHKTADDREIRASAAEHDGHVKHHSSAANSCNVHGTAVRTCQMQQSHGETNTGMRSESRWQLGPIPTRASKRKSWNCKSRTVDAVFRSSHSFLQTA
jgi:hypothetical protein